MRKYTELKTINSLNKMFKNYSLKEDGGINKSAIITSIIAEVPLPLIVLNRMIEDNNDVIKEILLGEKEIFTIISFLKDEFALEEDLSELNLKGKTFSELPEDIQDDFLEREVAIVSYYNINDLTRHILINRFSKTEIVNKIEQEELSKVDKFFNDSLGHEFFNRVNVNPISNDVIAQIWMLEMYGAIELSSRRINKFKEDLENEFNSLNPECDDLDSIGHAFLDSIEYSFNERLDFLAEAFTEKTNYLKKAHLPIIVLCVGTAIKEGISPEQFKEIMDKFFMNLDKHKKYKEAGSSHTTSKRNVEIRIKELTNFFKKEIK